MMNSEMNIHLPSVKKSQYFGHRYIFIHVFLSGVIRGVQSSDRARVGHKTRGFGPTQDSKTQEAACPLLPGAGVRAGASLQAAEVPVRPRERPPGRRAQTHPDPG